MSIVAIAIIYSGTAIVSIDTDDVAAGLADARPVTDDMIAKGGTVSDHTRAAPAARSNAS